jgi:hypothetical protein
MTKKEVLLCFIKYEDKYKRLHYAVKVGDDIAYLVTILPGCSLLELSEDSVDFKKMIPWLNWCFGKATYILKSNPVPYKIVFNQENFQTGSISIRRERSYSELSLQSLENNVAYSEEERRFFWDIINGLKPFK